MYHVSIELQSTCAYVQKVLSQVHVCRGTKREGEGRERERERGEGGDRQTDTHTQTEGERSYVLTLEACCWGGGCWWWAAEGCW